MDMIILILQIGVSSVFLYFGMLKVVWPIEKIAKKVTWAFDHSLKRIRLFGVIEVIGALGLLLPYRLDILPILTPMAATGLAMMMAGAGAVHLRRDELKMILLNIFIMFLLAGIGFHTLLDIFNVEM